MYEIILILHLIGVVFGAGSALVSDALFFGAIRDHHIEKTELNLLKTTGRLVWIGIGILLVTGFAMLVMSNFAFLYDAAFQVKMIVVGIIIVNGILLHKIHIPFLSTISKAENIDNDMNRNFDHWKSFKLMFVSGSVSAVSWLTVIILGSMRTLDMSFGLIMLSYVAVLGLALIIGQLLVYFMFPKHHSEKRRGHSFQRGILPYIAIIGLITLVFFMLVKPTVQSIDSHTRIDTDIVLTPKDQLVWDDGIHVAYAPEVPPSSDYTEQRMFEVKLEVLENVCTIDPENNISHDTWGYRVEGDDEIFCGSPGPVLRARVGDVARITLTNLPENVHPHNIDFHSVTGQGGGAADLTVAPGETASIDVRLLYPGSFMYHCAYGDVPVHIARGMTGMFIVDPAEPLPEADHEWSVMQSEWYLDEPDENGLADLDRTRLFEEQPNLVTFNGRTDALLGDNALNMNVGERARIYFVNEGLNLTSNFHPIGSHWDVVYPEGATHPANRVIYGSQSTSVVAGGGSVVEIKALVPSTIVLVDHALTRAFYKGAKGLINVHGEENPDIYSVHKLPRPLGEALIHEHENGEADSHDQSPTEEVQVIIPRGASAPSMADRAYQPNYITITKGTTVTWVNEDATMHTVTSGISDGKVKNPDGKFDSKLLKKGETFSYTFNESGEFPYYCNPHPWATGTVVVE